MSVTFRAPRRADLPAIVTLLADDAVNGHRERAGPPLSPAYAAAFDAIEADANNLLFVGEVDEAVVATAQVTFVPTLVGHADTRAIIEGVRVSSTMRSQGIGETLIAYCEEVARERGCRTVQLTTSMARVHAHRFYERLGYDQTHKGYKRAL